MGSGGSKPSNDAWASYLETFHGQNEGCETARNSPSGELGPRGGGGNADPGQSSTANQPNIDRQASNEDLLRAALLSQRTIVSGRQP